MLGLIANNNETKYKREVQHLVSWCHNHNLALNTKKTKEIVKNFHRERCITKLTLSIGSEIIERVESFKFLRVTVTKDLSWGKHISLSVGKAHQCLYHLKKLRSVHIPRPLMVNFYTCAISGILTYGF